MLLKQAIARLHFAQTHTRGASWNCETRPYDEQGPFELEAIAVSQISTHRKQMKARLQPGQLFSCESFCKVGIPPYAPQSR